jgi:PhoPQ-activated pathogenicity-related protein
LKNLTPFRPAWFLVPLAWAALAGPARADLLEYVRTPDPEFRWELKQKTDTDAGTVYDLHLVSQVWQGIRWEHQLQVYLPKGVTPGETLFLWNQGGKANAGSVALGMDLARKMGAPVAFLYDIPNQPLLGGLKEDALIAETFVRFLKTKDERWPLLFPMAKSLVRAMDALEAFAQKEWGVRLRGFIVSGGSKRGWTTWLTGAADPRVKAIAPLVIDTLNMVPQMAHQRRSFGKYSEMIHDYYERGLVPMPDTPEARRLWRIVDPYFYRDRITVPTLIVNGANDPYWAVDALNLYWDDLRSEKWVLYVPNAGHNLQQQLSGGRADRTRALSTLAAFARHQIKNTPMQKLSWKHTDDGGKLRLEVRAAPVPQGGRLWVAQAATRDFRKARWQEQPLLVRGTTAVGEVDPPAEGFVAFFGELDYEIDGLRYQLSTQVRVAGPATRR